MKRYHIVRRIVATVLLGMAVMAAPAADFDDLLAEFNRVGGVASANAFFHQLYKEEFTEQPLQFATGTPADTLRQHVWYWAAEYFYDRQQYQQALDYAVQALPLFNAGANRSGRADCLNLLAIVNVRLGDFARAADYAKQCYEIDVEDGDPDNISSSLNTLAGIYMSARQPREAEKYILSALDYARQADNPRRMAVLLGMASEVYEHLDDHRQALDYATQAWQQEQQLGRTDKAAIRQAQRASALIALGRGKEARQALDEAIPGLRQAGNTHSLGIACNQMGMLLHAEHDDSAAVRFYTEALAIFLEQHDLYNESFARKGLYDVLRQGDPTTAMQHIDRYNQLRDSIYDSETGMLLSKYAAEYNYQQLHADIAAQRSAKRAIAIVAVVVAVALILCLWLYRRRQLHRIRALLEKIEQMQAQQDDAGRPSADETPEQQPASDDFQLRVIGAINECMDQGDVSVDAVAQRMCMGVATFRRRLFAATGDRPNAYIQAVRMQRARTLLADSSLTIGEVAARCGFNEPTNFTRAFRATFGQSPTQFRSVAE